jgi:hypothetical protein
MSLPSRREILLDTQMNPQWASLKPAPAAHSEVRRLDDLGNPKDFPVKRPGFIFAARRHRKLDMIQPTDLRVT